MNLELRNLRILADIYTTYLVINLLPYSIRYWIFPSRGPIDQRILEGRELLDLGVLSGGQLDVRCRHLKQWKLSSGMILAVRGGKDGLGKREDSELAMDPDALPQARQWRQPRLRLPRNVLGRRFWEMPRRSLLLREAGWRKMYNPKPW